MALRRGVLSPWGVTADGRSSGGSPEPPPALMLEPTRQREGARRILTKLGLRDRVHAVAAYEAGLLAAPGGQLNGAYVPVSLEPAQRAAA